MKTKIIMALLAGSVLLAACKGSGNSSSMDTVARESTDSIKLVKTADMRFKVKNVQAVAEQISRFTIDAGGMVIHHDLRSNIVENQSIALGNDSVKKIMVYSPAVDLTIKLPAMLVEPFMDSLNHMGVYVDARKMDVEDRTLDYLSQRLKNQNRESSVKLRRGLKLNQKAADSILSLTDDMVDRKISNLRTDDASKFSQITLSLYQNNTVSKEIVASDDISSYKSPLGVRLGIALSQGWGYFSQLVIALLNLWPFLLLGGAVWATVIWYRRKKKTAAQTNS